MAKLPEHLEEIIKSGFEALHGEYLGAKKARDKHQEGSPEFKTYDKTVKDIVKRLNSLKAWQAKLLEDFED